MNYAIPLGVTPSLEIAGASERFPVRRIYCVGRNYAAHALEMGHDPNAEPPFFFQKPADTIIPNGADFPYPPLSENVQFELELVVALGTGGSDIELAKAEEHIFGYGVGLDMTRRDLQGEAKKMGRPWEVGKAFECSAPCSAIHRVADTGHPTSGAIWLEVNGERRQDADISHMIWKIPEVIVYLSQLFTLAPGDLIYTGTPAGVGPIQPGDTMHGGVENVDELTIKVV